MPVECNRYSTMVPCGYFPQLGPILAPLNGGFRHITSNQEGPIILRTRHMMQSHYTRFPVEPVVGRLPVLDARGSINTDPEP